MRPPSRHGDIEQSTEGEVAVARALFSNEAEWPDELAFRRGDTLRVLDERPGLPDGAPSQGWWLCADAEGRKGIVPANRLQIMQRFDQGFFQVANPLFNDFFMLSGDRGDDPFSFFPNHGIERLFPLAASDRFSQPSMRRLSSTDNALRGVVRHIPIRVEGEGSIPRDFPRETTLSRETRQSSLPPSVSLGVRRGSSSSGRISPPVPPTRKFFQHVGPGLSSSSATASSSEDDALLTPRPPPTPSRGRFSLPDQQLDRLAQRIRDLGSGRVSDGSVERQSGLLGERILFPSQERVRVVFPSLERDRRESPSPSSSGIGADLTDSSVHSQQEDKEKRSSDVSSLSNSSDPNSTYSDPVNDSDSRSVSSLLRNFLSLQPPPPTRVVPIQTAHSTRLTHQQPSTSVIQTVFDRLNERVRPPPQTSLPVKIHREETRPSEMPALFQRSPLTKISDLPAAEIEERKRVVCQKMTDNLRSMEVAVNRILQCTKPKLWRQPHVLQGHLSSLRDSVASVQSSLVTFLDVTSRISIDTAHHKSQGEKNPSPSESAELHDLLHPLTESRERLARLKSQLDRAGWTVAALSRPRTEGPPQHDALDHFIAGSQSLPSECRRLLQWTQLLIPSSQIVFLSSSSSGTASNTSTLTRSLLSPPFPVEEKRLSTSSTSTITSGDSVSPSSILVTKPSDRPRGRVTFADDAHKAVEKEKETPTAATPTPSTRQAIPPPALIQNGASRVETTNGTSEAKANGKREETPILPSSIEPRVMEEDDLESVASDRDSLYQDYALLEDLQPMVKEPRTRNATPRLNDEDRQLVRFYAPQLEEHTDGLAKAIDDFLLSVETQQPPREFVTKGKLIILAAHKLIYIGDSVSQCVSTASFSVQVRAAADRLCALLKHCVHATKLAVDEYPRVASIQAMVDSILGVSKAAHELTVLVRDSC